MKDKNKDRRFIEVLTENGFVNQSVIIVDRVTSVQYLYRGNSYGGGMTVLVDKDGKPLLYDSNQ